MFLELVWSHIWLSVCKQAGSLEFDLKALKISGGYNYSWSHYRSVIMLIIQLLLVQLRIVHYYPFALTRACLCWVFLAPCLYRNSKILYHIYRFLKRSWQYNPIRGASCVKNPGVNEGLTSTTGRDRSTPVKVIERIVDGRSFKSKGPMTHKCIIIGIRPVSGYEEGPYVYRVCQNSFFILSSDIYLL